MAPVRDVKIAVMGMGGVGKSALSVQFFKNEFIERYDPTIEDTYRKPMRLGGQSCMLEILDTAGIEQFTHMATAYIKAAHGFLLVYSTTDASSLEALARVRDQIVAIKETRRVPMVVVGNKSDLASERQVPANQGAAIADRWNHAPFYETSARFKTNVEQAFMDVVNQIIAPPGTAATASSQSRRASVSSHHGGNRSRSQSVSSQHKNPSVNRSASMAAMPVERSPSMSSMPASPDNVTRNPSVAGSRSRSTSVSRSPSVSNALVGVNPAVAAASVPVCRSASSASMAARQSQGDTADTAPAKHKKRGKPAKKGGQQTSSCTIL